MGWWIYIMEWKVCLMSLRITWYGVCWKFDGFVCIRSRNCLLIGKIMCYAFILTFFIAIFGFGLIFMSLYEICSSGLVLVIMIICLLLIVIIVLIAMEWNMVPVIFKMMHCHMTINIAIILILLSIVGFGLFMCLLMLMLVIMACCCLHSVSFGMLWILVTSLLKMIMNLH